jgi:hypothetical protein
MPMIVIRLTLDAVKAFAGNDKDPRENIFRSGYSGDAEVKR